MNSFTEEDVLVINKIIQLSIVAELSALEIRDASFGELKQRVNRLAQAGKSIQNYFQLHQNANADLRQRFKNEFLGGKNVLISEILTLLTNMSEEGVESVYNAIKEAIEREEHEKSPLAEAL